MPLIKKPGRVKEKKQIRIRLDEDIMQEISDYCDWAELPSLDYFFEQIALIALRKDREWKNKKEKISSQKLDGQTLNTTEEFIDNN